MSNKQRKIQKDSWMHLLAVDAALWTILYLAATGNRGAENLLTFVMAAFFAASWILLGAAARGVKEDSPLYPARSALRKNYVTITTLAEVGIMAWCGWFWIAGFHAWSTLCGVIARDTFTEEQPR